MALPSALSQVPLWQTAQRPWSSHPAGTSLKLSSMAQALSDASSGAEGRHGPEPPSSTKPACRIARCRGASS
eukprot:9482635-Pyramimonas_sp.AAC.1